MGDVGSAPIGFLIGVLGLWAASRDVPFVSTLILSGVFIVDATYTLLRRLSRGDRVWQAHRSHAYQRAAARWGHARVSMAVAVFDAPVAIPASVLVYLYPRFSGLVGALVGVVLLVTVISLRAGEER